MKNTRNAAIIIFLIVWAFLEPWIFYNFGATAVYSATIIVLFFAYLGTKKAEESGTSPGKTPKTEEEKKKIEFVSLTAHQFKAPLSTIKLSLKMFLDGEFGNISDEQRDIIKKIAKKNETLISLVNDLLDVAAVEDKKNFYGQNLADFEDVVFSAINSCREEMKNKKIVFELKKPQEKLPKIILDEIKMELAIQNIFDNAVKYTPEGGRIRASLSTDGRNIKFQIRDSGIGIPENQQEKIFTKFFRGSNAGKARDDGSGLGLFISKSIIEAHRGKIWFESQENKGTTFYVTLPLE